MRRLVLSNLCTALVVGAIAWLVAKPETRSAHPDDRIELTYPTGRSVTDASGGPDGAQAEMKTVVLVPTRYGAKGAPAWTIDDGATRKKYRLVTD